MVKFSKITPVAWTDTAARPRTRLSPELLSDTELKVLAFLYLLDENGTLVISRDAVVSAYPEITIQDSLDNLEKKGLYEKGSGINYLRRGPFCVEDFSPACNRSIPEQYRKMHEIASRYYAELQKSNDAVELASRRFFHSFIANDESEYLRVPDKKHGQPDSRNDDKSDFIVQPVIITVKPVLTPSERQFLITLARLLTHYTAPYLDRNVCMLEAARIWHKLVRQRPDEHIFEFIAVVDNLLMSVHYDDDHCSFGQTAATFYQNLLAFLDLAGENIPEFAEYCRFPVYLRLAEVYSNSNDAEESYWINKTVTDFGKFIRKYGFGYFSDYLAVLSDTGGHFRRVRNLKVIWLSILEMKDFCQKKAADNPAQNELFYADVLMRFSELILETMKIESAIVICDLSDNEQYEHAMSLYSYQEAWSREAIAIYKKMSVRDESLLLRYADAMELHAFGFEIRSSIQRVVPRNFWTSLIMLLGSKTLNKEIESALNEHSMAAQIFWSCAEKISREPHYAHKEYFTVMEKYLHSVFQMECSLKSSMNLKESSECLKKRIAVSRYIWKVENFYPELPSSGLLRDYRINIESLRKIYADIGDSDSVSLCDKELFSIEHPYEDIFGEEFRDPALISMLNDKAIHSTNKIYRPGTGMFRTYEVEPGKNVVITLWGNNGSVRAVFPDRFLHKEYINCSNVDISPLVNVLNDYQIVCRK